MRPPAPRTGLAAQAGELEVAGRWTTIPGRRTRLPDLGAIPGWPRVIRIQENLPPTR